MGYTTHSFRFSSLSTSCYRPPNRLGRPPGPRGRRSGSKRKPLRPAAATGSWSRSARTVASEERQGSRSGVGVMQLDDLKSEVPVHGQEVPSIGSKSRPPNPCCFWICGTGWKVFWEKKKQNHAPYVRINMRVSLLGIISQGTPQLKTVSGTHAERAFLNDSTMSLLTKNILVMQKVNLLKMVVVGSQKTVYRLKKPRGCSYMEMCGHVVFFKTSSSPRRRNKQTFKKGTNVRYGRILPGFLVPPGTPKPLPIHPKPHPPRPFPFPTPSLSPSPVPPTPDLRSSPGSPRSSGPPEAGPLGRAGQVGAWHGFQQKLKDLN